MCRWLTPRSGTPSPYPLVTIHDAEPTRVRKGRKIVKVEHSFDGRPLLDATRDRLPGIAAEHLREFLSGHGDLSPDDLEELVRGLPDGQIDSE